MSFLITPRLTDGQTINPVSNESRLITSLLSIQSPAATPWKTASSSAMPSLMRGSEPDDYVLQPPSSVMPASLWSCELLDIVSDLDLFCHPYCAEPFSTTASSTDTSNITSLTACTMVQPTSPRSPTPVSTSTVSLGQSSLNNTHNSPPRLVGVVHFEQPPAQLENTHARSPAAGTNITVPFAPLNTSIRIMHAEATNVYDTRNVISYDASPTAKDQHLPANILDGSAPNPYFFVKDPTFSQSMHVSRMPAAFPTTDAPVKQKQAMTDSKNKDGNKIKVPRGKRGPYKKKDSSKGPRGSRGTSNKRITSQELATSGERPRWAVASAAGRHPPDVAPRSARLGASVDGLLETGYLVQPFDFHQQMGTCSDASASGALHYRSPSMGATVLAEPGSHFNPATLPGPIDPALVGGCFGSPYPSAFAGPSDIHGSTCDHAVSSSSFPFDSSAVNGASALSSFSS